MRAPLIAIVLSGIGSAVCAQPVSEVGKELETCFQSARGADAICSDPKNGAAERLECLQKARTSHLECLEQVFGGTSAGPAPPEKPAGTGPSEMPSAAVSRDKPANIVVPNPPQAAAPSEMATGAVSAEAPAKAVTVPPRSSDANWIVSETTSPVDFSPLITAMTRLPASVKHAPNTLAIRCRGGRTELLVRTGGTWRVSRAREIQVEYQINDQPAVRLAWAASADGKTAIYKDDPVGLLQSLPVGARLKINVHDAPDASYEATFPLAGLDAVREKIAAACKWPPAPNKLSSEKR
jgi:hypothetical protein